MWAPTWRAPVTVETSAPRRERRRHVFMWLFTSIRNVAGLPVRVSVAAARAMRSMCLYLRRPWSARYDTDTRSLPGARGSTASLAPSPAQRRAREARIKTLVRLDSEGVFSSLTKCACPRHAAADPHPGPSLAHPFAHPCPSLPFPAPPAGDGTAPLPLLVCRRPLLDPTRLVADPTHLTSAIERNLDNRAPLLNWHIKHHSPAGVYDGLTTSGSMLEALVGALQIPGPDQVEAQIAEKRRQVADFKAGSRNVGEKARRAVSKRAAGGKGVELKEALMPMVNVEYKKLIEVRTPPRTPPRTPSATSPRSLRNPYAPPLQPSMHLVHTPLRTPLRTSPETLPHPLHTPAPSAGGMAQPHSRARDPAARRAHLCHGRHLATIQLDRRGGPARDHGLGPLPDRLHRRLLPRAGTRAHPRPRTCACTHPRPRARPRARARACCRVASPPSDCLLRLTLTRATRAASAATSLTAVARYLTTRADARERFTLRAHKFAHHVLGVLGWCRRESVPLI